MKNGFCQARMKTHGIEVRVPDTGGRTSVHDIIFEELAVARILDRSRDALVSLIEIAKAEGADSVILGCTELCLILDTGTLPLPGFESTAIHVESAVAFALGQGNGSTG